MIFLRCCEADKKRKLEKCVCKIPSVQDVSASSESEGIFLTETAEQLFGYEQVAKRIANIRLIKLQCQLQ